MYYQELFELLLIMPLVLLSHAHCCHCSLLPVLFTQLRTSLDFSSEQFTLNQCNSCVVPILHKFLAVCIGCPSAAGHCIYTRPLADAAECPPAHSLAAVPREGP